MTRIGISRAAGLAAIVLAAGLALMLALNLPGQLSYDSVNQLLDGRSGHYNSWHPAAMAWLLGLFDSLVPGTALFVIFQTALLALAFALLLRRRAGWGTPLVLLLIVATPQFLLYQGTVWKDILLADAALVAFAALARAAEARGGTRRALLALFFLALTLAGLMRQNGLLLLPVGALTFGALRADGGMSRGLRQAGAALLLLAALSLAVNLLLAPRGDGGEGLEGEIRLAQVYDLTGAARQGFRLDSLSRSDPKLAQLIRTKGVKAYSPLLQDTLEPALALPVNAAPGGAIYTQWKRLLLGRPDLYARERLPVFWQVLATPDVALCHPAYAGIDGDPLALKALGLTARVRPQDRWLASYTRGFMGTPILSHLTFVALSMLLLFAFWRRHQPADIAVVGLLTGALVYAASFLLVSVACDYRYLYLVDLSAMAAALHFVTFPIRRGCRPETPAKRQDKSAW